MAIIVKDGLNFQTIRESPLQPQDDITEWCAIRLVLSAPGHSNQPRRHIDVYNVYRPPIRTSTADERVNRFSLENFLTADSTLILGDVYGHHPDWDVHCFNPDRVSRYVHDWVSQHEWQVLNSGATTRAGYGQTLTSVHRTSRGHRDLARRCTWQVSVDLGSGHLPQLVTANVAGHRPRRIRKTRWAFHKTELVSFTAQYETSAAALIARDSVERLAAQFSGSRST